MSEARIVPHRLSRLFLIAAALLAFAIRADAAVAKSVSAELGELRTRFAALRSSQRWDVAAEQAFVTDLDAVAVRARSSRISSKTSSALRQLLEDTHRRYAGWLEQRRDAIIAADGDLEAAQETPQWQVREELALQILYHLNWVFLEAATRYESRSSQRREWLRRATEGFGEFMGVEGDAALTAESLFGRGLCRRALDQPDKAVADFRRALEIPAPPDLAARVGGALVEALIDAERLDDALKASRDLLRTSRSGEAEFLRAKTLLLVLASLELDDTRRRAYRREVTDLVGRLEKRGGNWARLARQLVTAGITRPEEWLEEGEGSIIQWVVAEALRGRGRCDEAVPLYEKLLAAEAEPPPETLLALGACQFDLQEFAAAYRTLSRVKMTAEGEAVADAAYLRFKAAEAVQHADPTQESAKLLEGAARETLAAFPDHPRAFEAYYRLGEIERERGNLLQAAAAFDAVAGETTFHLRAVFQAAQCSVEEWEKRVATGADSEELARDSLVRLRRFLTEAEEFRARPGGGAADEVMLSPMEAHARVLGALVLTSRERRADLRERSADLEEALTWLEGFDERYPAQKALHAKANALRAIALLELERFTAARKAVQELVGIPVRDERDHRLLRRLGARSLELAEEQRRAGNSEGESALRQQALSIYEELLRAVGAGELEGASEEGLRQLVKDLRAQQDRTATTP